MKTFKYIFLFFFGIVLFFTIYPGPRNCEDLVSNAAEFASDIENAGLVDSLNKISQRYGSNYFRVMMLKTRLMTTNLDSTSAIGLTFLHEDHKQHEWVPLFVNNNVGVATYHFGKIYFKYDRDFTRGKDLTLIYNPSDKGQVVDIFPSCKETEGMKRYNILIKGNWHLRVK